LAPFTAAQKIFAILKGLSPDIRQWFDEKEAAT